MYAYLFKRWTERILTRNIEPEEKKEVANILQETRPEEVEQMISNVERVLKKTYQDAEKKSIEQGIEQGMEQGIELVCDQGGPADADRGYRS